MDKYLFGMISMMAVALACIFFIIATYLVGEEKYSK